MSLSERSGFRGLAYSGWHRPESIGRFVGKRIAAVLKMVDIDSCEACHFCDEPLALIETQEGDRPAKRAAVTTRLARRAGIPAYSVSAIVDITEFRVRRLDSDEPEQRLTADEYAAFLVSLRSQLHACAGTQRFGEAS